MNEIITKASLNDTVIMRNGIEVVRSDMLAKVFEKQHKHILELIRNKIEFITSQNFDLKNFFIEERVTTAKGKEYTRYYLTKNGFDFVALSLQGRKADLYKLWYIQAFNDMSEIIKKHKLQAELNSYDDLWKKFRDEGKVYRKKLTDTINKYVVEYRKEVENKQNDGRYFQHYTQLIYKKLNINLPYGADARDVLDKRMLIRLEDLEDRVADLIEKYTKDNIYYKDVYKQIKQELLT